MDALKHMYTER